VHRCLLIHVSGALDEALERLRSEHQNRLDAGRVLTQVAFVSAPASGVGNLTNPLEILRKNLWEDIRKGLTSLLKATPGQRDPFTLDIFVVCDFGSPNALEALKVCLDAIEENLAPFRGIFPAHEIGPSRRWRVYTGGFLGIEKRDSERRDGLRRLVQELRKRKAAGSDERLVDRVFLLDSLTPRGMCSTEELLGHLANFCALIVLGNLRGDPRLMRSLTEPGNDPAATFGCVRATLKMKPIQLELSRLLLEQMVDAARKTTEPSLPSPSEVLPRSLPNDEELRLFSERLRGRVVETLNVEGVPALLPLTRWLEKLLEFDESTFRQNDPVTEVAPKSSAGTVIGLSISAGFGIAAYALAAFALGLSALASAGTSLAVFVAGLGAFALFKGFSSSKSEPKTKDEEDDPALEALEAEIQKLRSALLSISENLKIAAIPTIPLEKSVPETDAEETPWEVSLGDIKIAQTLLDTAHPHGSGADSLLAFLRDHGTWEELLDEPVRLAAGAMAAFSDNVAMGTHALEILRSAPVQEDIAPHLRRFLDTWQHGVPLHLDLSSKQLHDTDGIRTASEDVLVAPDVFKGLLRDLYKSREARAESAFFNPDLLDVWLVSIVHDIHEDAIPTFDLS